MDSDPSTDVRARVQQALADEIAPALAMDGTQVEVLDVSGVARLRVGGRCSGCPSTVMAVIMGLEHELRQRVPEIEYVEVSP